MASRGTYDRASNATQRAEWVYRCRCGIGRDVDPQIAPVFIIWDRYCIHGRLSQAVLPSLTINHGYKPLLMLGMGSKYANWELGARAH